jgi:hypothetical protein
MSPKVFIAALISGVFVSCIAVMAFTVVAVHTDAQNAFEMEVQAQHDVIRLHSLERSLRIEDRKGHIVRKFVQVAVAVGAGGFKYIYAVTDDGVIMKYDSIGPGGEFGWVELPKAPDKIG